MSPDAQKVWSIAVEQYHKDREPYVECISHNFDEFVSLMNGTHQLEQDGYIEDVEGCPSAGETVGTPCVIRFHLSDSGRARANAVERKA